MKATLNGIQFYKPELRVLLEFAESAKEAMLAVVHLRIAGDRVFAYATDGRRAVQAMGDVDAGVTDGEWTVFRHFLDHVHKLLDANQFVLLEVSGASLHRAVIMDGESLQEVESMICATDAASTQMSFPLEPLNRLIRLPVTQRPVRCVSVPASQLASLSHLGKAASETLDLYPGKDRQSPITFQCEGSDTIWTGLIQPMKQPTESETDDIDDDPEMGKLFPFENPRDKRKGKGSAEDRTGDLPFDGPGATVTSLEERRQRGETKMTVQVLGADGKPEGEAVTTSLEAMERTAKDLESSNRKKKKASKKSSKKAPKRGKPGFVPPTEA